MTWTEENNRELLADFAIWLARKKVIIDGFQWDDLVARFLAERKIKAAPEFIPRPRGEVK